MVRGNAKIKNFKGLHIKPAKVMSSIALMYSCKVYLEVREYHVNAKSVLGILSAQVKQHEEVGVVCDGPDEEAALQAILDAIDSGFGMV